MIKTLNSPSDGQYNWRATTNEELLVWLRVIEVEIFHYAYDKTQEGLRFAGREEIATAGAAINRAIEEIERKVEV